MAVDPFDGGPDDWIPAAAQAGMAGWSNWPTPGNLLDDGYPDDWIAPAAASNQTLPPAGHAPYAPSRLRVASLVSAPASGANASAGDWSKIPASAGGALTGPPPISPISQSAVPGSAPVYPGIATFDPSRSILGAVAKRVGATPFGLPEFLANSVFGDLPRYLSPGLAGGSQFGPYAPPGVHPGAQSTSTPAATPYTLSWSPSNLSRSLADISPSTSHGPGIAGVDAPGGSDSNPRLAQAILFGLPPSFLFTQPPEVVLPPRGMTPLEELPPGSWGGDNAYKVIRPKPNDYPEGTPCMYCRQPTTRQPGRPNTLEREHTFPRSRGGNTDPENVGPSCRTCNRWKGGRTPVEWYRSMQADNGGSGDSPDV